MDYLRGHAHAGSGGSSAGEDRSAERGAGEQVRSAAGVVLVVTEVGERAVRDPVLLFLAVCRSWRRGGGGLNT